PPHVRRPPHGGAQARDPLADRLRRTEERRRRAAGPGDRGAARPRRPAPALPRRPGRGAAGLRPDRVPPRHGQPGPPLAPARAAADRGRGACHVPRVRRRDQPRRAGRGGHREHRRSRPAPRRGAGGAARQGGAPPHGPDRDHPDRATGRGRFHDPPHARRPAARPRPRPAAVPRPVRAPLPGLRRAARARTAPGRAKGVRPSRDVKSIRGRGEVRMARRAMRYGPVRPTDLDTGGHLAAAQQPDWPDRAERERVARERATMPPLVFAGECDQLKERLAAVTRGEAFVLQGGDCAETFSGATADNVRNKLKTLLQMAIVLTYAGRVPVVKIGRMAGQFAKPRSKPVEVRDGVELPAYRGDMVNGFDFTAEARRPDPARLLRAYHCSAATLNLARAFTKGGYADLRQVHAWNQDFVAESPAGQRYERLAREIDQALAFIKACGGDPSEFHT